MTGVFITSSGTGIGKTYLTESLLRYDRSQQSRLSASKPIISGWPAHELDIHHTDTARIIKAQGLACHTESIQAISPWRFQPPLSPDLAAFAEGKTLATTDLIQYCQQQILHAKQHKQCHLIEGVGGVMCPISAGVTVLDWIKKIDCPCLLVVGSYLGTLSHTLTALHALQSQRIPILGLVINETPQSTVSLKQIVHSLREFTADIPIFALSQQWPALESEISPIYMEVLKILLDS